MAADQIDLPANVASNLLMESVSNMQASNRNGRMVGDIAMGVLATGAANKATKLDTLESRANSGVMATPIAGPTTQVGP